MTTRHGVPSTITTTGRVVQTWLPGEANNLTGMRRLWELWRRLRRQHNRRMSWRIAVAAHRHGYVLSGPGERS
jgi:hypothetical protein